MAKRIVIFLDGTWNLLSAAEPTNVVLSAQMVSPFGAHETQQIIYYKQGVGTSFLFSRFESLLAGALGLGLFDNIAEAYRFLVFNYEIGDEIYVFGFSRGAFTARSLVALIRLCGIINSDQAEQIDKGLELFRSWNRDGGADGDLARTFRAEYAPDTVMGDDEREWRRSHGYKQNYDELPDFSIRYLGVWDTVAALGVPKHLLVRRLLNSSDPYEFDSLYLTSIVEASRHAVAIHENRLSFSPTLIDNIDTLNAMAGRAGRYRQLWFPGDHGSVGGGGDIRGLSHAALLWILEGAAEMGLGLDEPAMENARLEIDPTVSLHNTTKKPGFFDWIYRRKPRDVPTDQALLSESAIKRKAWEDAQARTEVETGTSE